VRRDLRLDVSGRVEVRVVEAGVVGVLDVDVVEESVLPAVVLHPHVRAVRADDIPDRERPALALRAAHDVRARVERGRGGRQDVHDVLDLDVVVERVRGRLRTDRGALAVDELQAPVRPDAPTVQRFTVH
jgi:hypothetical protein